MSFNFTNVTIGLNVPARSPPSNAEKVWQTILFTVIVLLSLLGNSLVICAVVSKQRMRSITNYLIVNVSVCDLLYTIVVTPSQFIQIYGLHNWVLGSFTVATLFCKVINFLQLTFVTSSLLTLAALAVDRYFAVMSPLRQTITKTVFVITLGGIWLLAASVCFPFLHAMKVKDNNGSLQCIESWDDDQQKSIFVSRAYTIALFVVMYCVPLLAMTILYSRISWFLWLRRAPGTQLEANQRNTEQSKKKVIKMLITVVLLFVLCWLPYQVITFVVFYNGNVSLHLYLLCDTLMRINPCLNPLVYAIFSENYRQAFKEILLSWVYCRRKYQQVPFQSARSTMVSQTNNNSNVSPNFAALELRSVASDCART